MPKDCKIKLNSFKVELISNNNYFIFQPLLPEVASGAISESDAVTPIRQILKNVNFRHADIKQINFEQKYVVVVQGFRRREHKINFDHLVIALGQESNKQIIKGLAHHSFTMRNLKDAYNLRNHMLRCLELADVTQDLNLKKRLLNIVVVGGGFLLKLLGSSRKCVKDYYLTIKNIKKKELKFHIVEFSDRLLPELDNQISIYTRNVFIKRNINVILKTALKEVSIYKVMLSDGKVIETNTIISTIGSTVCDLIKDSALPLKNGKIITNKFLEVVNHDNIWALGDNALIPNSDEKDKAFCPPTAQFAVRQARILAKNIVLKTLKKDLRQFQYSSKGSLASLGSKKE